MMSSKGKSKGFRFETLSFNEAYHHIRYGNFIDIIDGLMVRDVSGRDKHGHWASMKLCQQIGFFVEVSHPNGTTIADVETKIESAPYILSEFGFDIKGSTWKDDYDNGFSNDYSEKNEGYLYLIHMQGTNYYKIGRAKNAKHRIKDIGILLPTPVETICTMRTQVPVALEKEYHQMYAVWRTNGEWFEFPKHIVDELKDMFSGSF